MAARAMPAVSGTWVMSWPVPDPRISVADMLGEATADLRAVLAREGLWPAGHLAWSLGTDRRQLQLAARIDVTSRRPEEPAPPRERCGSHAGYQAHRRAGEAICPACSAGEREYRRVLRERAARRAEEGAA